jgi:hypothetical protein
MGKTRKKPWFGGCFSQKNKKSTLESETDGNEAFFKAAQTFVDYRADKIRRQR